MANVSKKQLIKKLKFYAKPTNYERRHAEGSRAWENPRVLADRGQKAREVLAAVGVKV